MWWSLSLSHDNENRVHVSLVMVDKNGCVDHP